MSLISSTWSGRVEEWKRADEGRLRSVEVRDPNPQHDAISCLGEVYVGGPSDPYTYWLIY